MADDQGSEAEDEIELRPTAAAPASAPAPRRRRALWGALAAVAVAAGALAATAGRAGDGLPLLPSASASQREGGAATAAADMALAWVRYVAGDGLPALGGTGSAYRLSSSADPDRVRALAEALGLDGDVQSTGGAAWRVTGGEAVLEVVGEGGGAWWYSATSPDRPVTGGGSSGCEPDGDGGCATPECAPGPATDCGFAGDGTVTTLACLQGEACALDGSACPGAGASGDPGHGAADDAGTGSGCDAPMPVEPPAATDLPTQDEARRIALRVLEATGAELDGAAVTVDGPYDAWYVGVEPRVGGVPVSGWYSSVVVGPEGRVLSANGILASVERIGDYPLLTTAAAVDRLNAQQDQLLAQPVGDPEAAIAGDGAPASGSSSASAAAPDTSPPLPCDADLAPEERDRCLADGGVVDRPDQPSCIGSTAGAGGEPSCPDDVSPTTTVCRVEPAEPPMTTVPGEAPAVAVAPQPGCEPVPTPDPQPVPVPLPEPAPLEVVLTEVEPVLVLTMGPDGAYLVPGYRFGNEDGHQVDAVAVADDHLAPTTTVPAPDLPTPATEPAPAECEVLVEDDRSGTTHTIQACPGEILPSQPDVVHLGDGEEPQVGVPYYVDVDLRCAGGSFVLGQVDGAALVWVLEKGDTTGWASPHEGGTFTLDGPDHGTFVGDAEGSKAATFTALGPAADIFCSPQPRG